MLGNHGGFRGGQTYAAPLATPILDDLSISATGAYSLRKMRTAYAGSCIRVRRSSDNTEQDIGFVLNVLDTASLLTFVGAGNGFVTTWYDQSGNGLNATQGTAGSQPSIVASGVVTTSNSKPAVQFASSFLSFSNTTPGNYSAFIVAGRTSTGHVLTNFARSDSQLPLAIGQNVDGNVYISNGAVFATYSGSPTGQKVFCGFSISGTLSAYENGVSKSLSVSGAGFPNTFNSIGSSNGILATGFMSELILVSSDESAKRTSVETNFRSYYNTY